MGEKLGPAATAGMAADLRARIASRARRSVPVLLALVLPASGVAQITIDEPLPDSLATSTRISLRGTVVGDASVQVLAGDLAEAAESGGGVWSIDNVPLPDTLNEITVKAGAAKEAVLVTKVTSLSARSTQVVVLNWSAEATDEIKKIGVGTRLNTMASSDQDSFASSVQLQTEALIAANFAQFAIEVVTQSDSEDVHIVNFLGLANGTYGETSVDCGNSNAVGTSTVFVGTLRSSMVSKFGTWGPMKRTDKIAVRVQDVAYALAHTATHEIGHGLGLVVSPAGPASCAWMNGCGGNHNCSTFDSSHVLADRFDSGRYILDPATPQHIRIGEGSKVSRGQHRVPATFNAVTAAYLALIHPR
jgi:hypothetical protein